MRSSRLLIFMLAAGLVAAPRFSQAQEAGEHVPSLEEESEHQADMFGLPQGAPARREDAVNYRISGTVRSVTDGDTIALTGKRNVRFVIRLSDMDTPETSHRPFTPRDCKCAPVPFRPGQVGGREATEVLRSLISVGDQVTAECYELDDYGRSICHVFKGAMNVNLEMIRKGWGWLPERREWVRDEASIPAERVARAAGLGAWGLARQLSPSEWRQQCWRAGDCEGAVNWPDRP
jgi:endonuclease YncB( thermonuclease family)